MRGNTAERWGSVQIGLHWTIAALVLLVQVPAGITMVAVARAPTRLTGRFTDQTMWYLIVLDAPVWFLRTVAFARPQ